MITSLTPRYKFKDCTGTLLEDGEAVHGSTFRVYVPNLMPKPISKDKPASSTETVYSVTQMCLNPDSCPKGPNTVTKVNYIIGRVDEDILFEQANEELYQKYLREYPYPTPIYFIPKHMSLEKGRKVNIHFENQDLRHPIINLKKPEGGEELD